MPKMNVNESITIKAPVNKVFEVVSDFNKWIPWSPWLIMEPEAKVTIAEDAQYYEWEGKRVGSGNMKILNAVENKSVDYDLNFLKPWKSHANVKFELQEQGEETKVTWTMDSSLPIFMFWMKKMMEAFVSMDYERGLMMLKEYVEDGEVSSELQFKGTSDYAGCNYIGIKTTCTKDEIGEKMTRDLKKLGEIAAAQSDKVAGKPFSIYHKFDLVKGKVIYTSGIPVKETPSDLPSGVITGSIPASKIYAVGHKGPYKHLGNAWSAAQNIMRSKEVKVKKGIHPFEIYENNPEDVSEKELQTDIYFAVK